MKSANNCWYKLDFYQQSADSHYIRNGKFMNDLAYLKKSIANYEINLENDK